MKYPALPLALLITAFGLPAAGYADSPLPTAEEMWEIIQSQQKEIEALKRQQQTTEQKATAADEKAEAAVVAVESGTGGSTAGSSWADRTQIGGYGELHYNNIDASDPAR